MEESFADIIFIISIKWRCVKFYPSVYSVSPTSVSGWAVGILSPAVLISYDRRHMNIGKVAFSYDACGLGLFCEKALRPAAVWSHFGIQLCGLLISRVRPVAFSVLS